MTDNTLKDEDELIPVETPPEEEEEDSKAENDAGDDDDDEDDRLAVTSTVAPRRLPSRRSVSLNSRTRKCFAVCRPLRGTR